jgi:hypothetical protein
VAKRRPAVDPTALVVTYTTRVELCEEDVRALGLFYQLHADDVPGLKATIEHTIRTRGYEGFDADCIAGRRMVRALEAEGAREEMETHERTMRRLEEEGVKRGERPEVYSNTPEYNTAYAAYHAARDVFEELA